MKTISGRRFTQMNTDSKHLSLGEKIVCKYSVNSVIASLLPYSLPKQSPIRSGIIPNSSSPMEEFLYLFHGVKVRANMRLPRDFVPRNDTHSRQLKIKEKLWEKNFN